MNERERLTTDFAEMERKLARGWEWFDGNADHPRFDEQESKFMESLLAYCALGSRIATLRDRCSTLREEERR